MLPTRHTGVRPPRLALVSLALLVALGLSLPASATADGTSPGPGSSPADPQLPEQAAEQALANAQAALAGDDDLEPTLALAELSTSLDDLSGADRREAERVLARPTDDLNDCPRGYAPDSCGALKYETAPTETLCLTNLCVHYATSGTHRPPNEAWAEKTARVVEKSWRVEIGKLGYQRPKGDGRAGNPAGEERNDLLDVYLGDVGSSGIFGYAAADPKAGYAPYLVLDNDFKEFGGKPIVLLRATAAHELFHAVQFAYDRDEDPWFMESTATWMEEQVFDGANDNRYYLSESSLTLPGRSLDSGAGGTWYGNWIFFQFASERFGPRLVKDMWERAGRAAYSTQAINRALKARNSSMAKLFSSFSSGNAMPARHYQEGRHYVPAPIARAWTLQARSRSTGKQSLALRHLTSRNHTFLPGRSLTGPWKLRIAVNGPNRISRARILVHLRDGSVVRRPVKLDWHGNGSITTRFARAKVSRVVLNLANTSISYRCWTGGAFACSGKPVKNKRPFAFTATTSR